MQRRLVHPDTDSLSLAGILHALADPARLAIVRKLADGQCPLNCSEASPDGLARSTQSHHYQLLREAGLIRSERRGTEVVNTLRAGDLETRFPGLLSTILAAAAR